MLLGTYNLHCAVYRIVCIEDFQAQFRHMRQTRDTKQTLNGRQPIFLFFSY